MDYFGIGKLAVDVLLVLALVHLCYRFAKAGSGSGVNSRFAGLETSLRMLVQDADNAGQVLNEKLLKRKTSLEKLLFDLETVEQRLNRAISVAEGSKTDLDSEAARLQSLLRQSSSAAAVEAPSPARPVQSAGESAIPAAVERTVEHPAPISKDVLEPASFQRDSAPAADADEGAAVRARASSNVNIYGEPIPPARSGAAAPERPAAKRTSALAKAIEKESLPRPYAAAAATQEMQQIYDAAENLLRTGASLETVVAETALPAEEVRLLAQMIRQEKAMNQRRSADRADSRLGVLGSGISRRVETL
jgi:hypothetical protein